MNFPIIGASDSAAATPENAITGRAMSLTRVVIAPRSRHARIAGPHHAAPSKRCSRCGEDRAKQAAARMSRGVPGRSGRNTPANPSGARKRPAMPNRILSGSCIISSSGSWSWRGLEDLVAMSRVVRRKLRLRQPASRPWIPFIAVRARREFARAQSRGDGK